MRQDGDTWPTPPTATSRPSAPAQEAGLPSRPRGLADPEGAGRGRRRAGADAYPVVDALEESDDVQDVYFNFDIPEAVLADA